MRDLLPQLSFTPVRGRPQIIFDWFQLIPPLIEQAPVHPKLF
jgi:hypothetical protein